MTKGSTKEQAEDVKQYIQDQLVDQDWVKKIFLDSDDHGVHVVVKVDKEKYKTSGHHVPAAVNEVKIVTMMVG